MTALVVDDITVSYGRLTALRGVTLTVDEGEILFVTGPNGAGKSTLLNAIAGVVPPGSGSIMIDGARISGAAPEDIARRGFSLVPEGRNVFGALTIEENLKVGTGMRADRNKIAGDLESVYRDFPMLAERRHTTAGMLSGGQQQMLVIGRALMSDPKVILLGEDEIAAGIRHAYAREREIVEGAGAVGIAALLAGKVKAREPVVVLLSGRNIDMNAHRRIVCDEAIGESAA